MRWQLGGNLQPVRMICELDWRECPGAIINYVWSEIVTDVVECLTNEWIMWRVIAMLFVCTLLIHTMYSKARLMDETSANRNNLNVVGCKVQDLELKVNILTYKMQYGTWPLPRQIRGTGIERELRNVRLTLTNSNDRNAWLKHMLLSPTENAKCVPYAKIGPRSVRCLTKLINLETKYMSSRFGRDHSSLSQKELSSSSERSLKYEVKTSRRTLLEGERAKKQPRSEDLGTRREKSAVNEGKRRATSWSETGVAKCRDPSRKSSHDTSAKCDAKRGSKKSCQETPEERVNATSETLQEVKKKLEELHNVLRIYGSSSTGNETGLATNKQLAETILKDLRSLGDDLPESESDSKTRDSLTRCPEHPITYPINEDQDKDEITSEFEQCRSEFSSNCEFENVRAIEDPPGTKTEERIIGSSAKTPDARDSHPSEHGCDDRLEKSSSDGKSGEEACSAISSAAEISRDSDTDERSNVILLREAFEFRNALVTRLELENVDERSGRPAKKIISEHPEVVPDETRSRTKLNFQPKLLDIISEEHSAGSSTEKSAKARLEIERAATCRETRSCGLTLASSSEYFSLSSIDLETIIPETSDTEYPKEDKTQGDLNDLVNRSVRNIRDYVEAFSRLQNDAIAETRRAINDENVKDISPRPTASVDSITRFVNNLAFTISEELPRDLSEPLMTRVANRENSDEDSPGTSGSTRDYVLERRPGTISLADKSIILEEQKVPGLRDTVQSNVSETSLSSVTSCKQSRDYSETDSCDARQVDAGLAILDEDARQENDSARFLDSPLTGRTVIRATGSSLGNLDVSTNRSLESLDTAKRVDDEPEESSTRDSGHRDSNVAKETSSLYFTDQASLPDIQDNFCETPDTNFTRIERNSFDDRISKKPELETNYEVMEAIPEAQIRLASPKIKPESQVYEEPEVTVEAEIIGKQEVQRNFEYPASRIEVHEAPEVSSLINSLPERSEMEEVIIEKPEVRTSRAYVTENPDTIVLREESLIASLRSASGGVLVENAPGDATKGSNVSEEPSGIYVDVSSREFSNASVTSSLGSEKRSSRGSKSARGSSSSPLQQRQRSLTGTIPRRGSSLEMAERSDRGATSRETSGESSKIGKQRPRAAKSTDATTRVASHETTERRSRSYATPRKSENASGSQDVTGTRRNPAIRRDATTEKKNSPIRCASSGSSPRRSAEPKPETSRSETGSRPCTAGSASARTRPSDRSTVRSDTRDDETEFGKVRSERSSLGRNTSRSCIPVLRSRLEVTRQCGHEKRGKSPARCPLTMSTSSWKQENRSAPVTAICSDPKTEGNPSSASAIETNRTEAEQIPERRTVIYVNIVTEHKSATRIVDPKKFLEYLKDRDLKIQSVQDETTKTNRPGVGADSPRILTVVSSAVDERPSENTAAQSRGSWSLRVERREIEVSAKPSVMDTSTSISDLPETQSAVLERPKFQIFEVPKELTKDEYIVLLETLNRDPNLEQLREMHQLCDKLGLGFNE